MQRGWYKHMRTIECCLRQRLRDRARREFGIAGACQTLSQRTIRIDDSGDPYASNRPQCLGMGMGDVAGTDQGDAPCHHVSPPTWTVSASSCAAGMVPV